MRGGEAGKEGICRKKEWREVGKGREGFHLKHCCGAKEPGPEGRGNLGGRASKEERRGIFEK